MLSVARAAGNPALGTRSKRCSAIRAIVNGCSHGRIERFLKGRRSSPQRNARADSQIKCSAMFSENWRQASRRTFRAAAAARGNFIQLLRNFCTLIETKSAAFDVPCADAGVDLLQMATGASALATG